jgi:hypothetical protein
MLRMVENISHVYCYYFSFLVIVWIDDVLMHRAQARPRHHMIRNSYYYTFQQLNRLACLTMLLEISPIQYECAREMTLLAS